MSYKTCLKIKASLQGSGEVAHTFGIGYIYRRFKLKGQTWGIPILQGGKVGSGGGCHSDDAENRGRRRGSEGK